MTSDCWRIDAPQPDSFGFHHWSLKFVPTDGTQIPLTAEHAQKANPLIELSVFMRGFLATNRRVSGICVPSVGTNFSDQWWNPNESGWGASILQQSDVIFVDLFVYGSDGLPTWFTASASPQGGGAPGHVVFAGDLYRTNGPWFAGPFNPNFVTYRKVGTLIFD